MPTDDQTRARNAGSILSQALARGLLGPGDTAAVFYDLDALARQLARVRRAFPPSALHASAIKANPLVAVLRHLARWEAGAEAASLPELKLAQAAGFPGARIVFDSPAKTPDEIAYALAAGVHVNADSLDELDRIAAARARVPGTGEPCGVRVNPQVGIGHIEGTSTAGVYSKFGVPLDEQRAELWRAFERHAWLRGVHVHIGSQGCPLELLVAGVRRAFDFAREVDLRLGPGRIQFIDIGGGLPVAYRPEDAAVTVEEYAARLREGCPALFDGTYRLITEFGRHLHARAGWIASRVEYVKEVAGIPTAILHVGADLLVRECLQPELWFHRISVHDPHGRPREGGGRCWNLAGPLCFSGDMPARGVPLPEIRAGDLVVFHDAGAYTLSMWSRYNSRPMPRVIGYGEAAGGFEILKERERPDALVDFWDAPRDV
ncbi:MAG: alanine racemase [Candidatus Eisenbacteria bacterium]